MPAPQDRPWTSGEWRIEDMRQINGAFWIGVDLPDVGFVSHAEVRTGCDEAREIGDAEANAHLIAAAKKLYAALSAVVSAWEDKSGMGTMYDMQRAIPDARFALAFALGERP